MVAGTLGRASFEGGIHRRSAQLIQQILERALNHWLRDHPHYPPSFRHQLLAIHQQWVSGRSVRFCALSGAFLTSVEVPIERRAVDTKLLRHLTC